MWIKMLQTYSGPLGLYPAGQKFDLPEAAIEKLPKTVVIEGKKKKQPLYEPTCAPWDEQKDKKAIQLAKDKGEALYALSRADKLQTEAEQLQRQVDELVAIVSQNQAASQKAEANAKEMIAESKSGTASKELKKKAFGLAREAEIRDLIFEKVQGEFRVAVAVAGLKRMEAEDAKKYAEQKAKEAGIEQADVTQSEDANNAKGQAVSA